MNSSPAHKTSDERFIADLIQAYLASGETKPVLPAGRREDAVAMLTGLLAARDRFEDYVSSLEATLEHQGVRLRLLKAPDLEIPDDQIAREGFRNLADDHLADIALSPEALVAIRDYLDEPEHEAGTWHIQAILADERSRPPDPEGYDRAVRALEKVRGPVSPDRVFAPNPRLDDPKARRLGSGAVRWLGGSLGLAAGLLLGFLLGMQMRGVESDLDATGARITPGGALGGQAWTIEVPSDRRAFVTIAVLGPNNIPEFYPESGKFLEAQPGKPLRYTIQANAGDSLFVILTETPATDVLNNVTATAVNTRQQAWRDADSFRASLEETLRSLGFRRFAVRRIVLTR